MRSAKQKKKKQILKISAGYLNFVLPREMFRSDRKFKTKRKAEIQSEIQCEKRMVEQAMKRQTKKILEKQFFLCES